MKTVNLYSLPSDTLSTGSSITDRREKVVFLATTLLLLLLGITSLVAFSFGIFSSGLVIGLVSLPLVVVLTIIAGMIVWLRQRHLQICGDVLSYLKCKRLWTKIDKNLDKNPMVDLGREYALWQFAELVERAAAYSMISLMRPSFLVYFYYTYRIENDPQNPIYHLKRLYAAYSILSCGLRNYDSLIGDAKKSLKSDVSSETSLLTVPNPIPALTILRGALVRLCIDYQDMKKFVQIPEKHREKFWSNMNSSYERLMVNIKKSLKDDLESASTSGNSLSGIWSVVANGSHNSQFSEEALVAAENIEYF